MNRVVITPTAADIPKVGATLIAVIRELIEHQDPFGFDIF
jgi:hypothetical protein